MVLIAIDLRNVSKLRNRFLRCLETLILFSDIL